MTDYEIFENNEHLSEKMENLLSSVEGLIFIVCIFFNLFGKYLKYVKKDKGSQINDKLYHKLVNLFNPSMQVIFKDTSEHQVAKTQDLDLEEDAVFIETVYEKFDNLEANLNVQTGLMSQETDGIFRIFEIIECTMWSQMVVNKLNNLLMKFIEKNQKRRKD